MWPCLLMPFSLKSNKWNYSYRIGGNLQDVQNKLSSALDLVESILNLFSFAVSIKPQKC